jgi:hydrogenase nickel incorporation protein HypB
MMHNALTNIALKDVELLFVENVGNLICPAGFALGEHLRVLISSVPEGDDKPLKYPGMFHTVNAVLLNKIDLLPYVQFDISSFSSAVRGINREVEILPISCTRGEGIEEWVSWLMAQATKK